MIQEILKAFDRALRRELKLDEHIVEVEENAGGIWFTTNKGRTLELHDL